MLGLPTSTEINKPLAKRVLFAKFKAKTNERKLFDEQISRLAIVAEISPQTVNIAASAEISALFVVLLSLKSAACDKMNIALLAKLIDQRMLFTLQFEDTMRLAVYRAGQVLISESKPVDEWKLSLSGLDLKSLWENIIAEVGGINLAGGKELDEIILANERRGKLTKQIATLQQNALNERQPRRKWQYVKDIKRLKAELEELDES